MRTASVRRPDAEVMAPALTDTAQPQNFNLPPKSHLEPASPINSFETNKYSPTSEKKCEPASPLNTDDLSTSLDNVDSVNLSTKKPRSEGYLTELNSASDNFFAARNMSLSLSPMGDREDRMGLQKTGLNVSNASKVKNTTEEDQLFNTNLEANVEDIMQQVIKSIENSDPLNNSSNDFNEVLDLNIDKELLEHVDNMINISMDDHQDDLETAQKIKENQADTLLTDLQRKHSRVERRLDFLRRRCYKLQAKFMGQHVSKEVAGVFEQVHRSIKKPKDSIDVAKGFGSSSESTEKLKPLSASSAKLLARKLEMAKILQANTAARQKNVPKYFGSGSIESSMFRNATSGQVNIPHWSIERKQELQKVAEQLQTQLHLVQDELDSEATESSSGGESCDELQSYNNPHQQYLSIQKRALWKYSTDRAAIAARWTWLQSQISDLEYRIRQHTELHKQIRAAKGAVQLGDVVIRPKPVQSQSEIAGHHDYGVTSTETSYGPTAVNGYLGQLPGATTSKPEENEEDCQRCARARPLANFRKRRLLQVAGLHAISKKAARPSTVRCSCVPSRVPCALCTGRADPTHPRDPPDTLGKAEKVALLDPGFHPVLSLPEDTSQSLHLEAIMKMHEWQQRSLKMKTMKVLHKPERMEQRALEHRTKKLEHRKKYGRLKPSTVSALSEKIKKKLRGRKVGRPAGISKFKKRQSQPTLSQHLQNLDTVGSEDAEVEAMIGSGSQTPVSGTTQTRSVSDSPGGSPLLHMQSISGYKHNTRNSRIDSYDIDNIVIPYSVAASTRVEKLQYKEILTPKWRIAEADIPIKVETKNNGIVSDLGEDSDVEDFSDDAMVSRHDRCEHDEKKRFLSYMKFPLGYGRQRSHKRHDSLADSSRANTPDPPSPHPEGAKTGADGSTLLMASPPPTPGGATDEPLPSIALMRRRTVSQSRLREVNEGPLIDYVEQPPYEPRTFPLTDSDYECMVQEVPDAHREVRTNYRAQDTGDDVPVKAEADSADSESTESAIGEDAIIDDETMLEDEDEEEEDPNDPEWTDADKSGHKERHHRR